MNEDYKELCKVYECQIQAFALFYQDRLRFSMALMTLSGIITQMEVDIATYRLKNGSIDKIQPVINRAKSLTMIYDDLQGLDNLNQRYKLILNGNIQRIDALETENALLKKQLQFTD